MQQLNLLDAGLLPPRRLLGAPQALGLAALAVGAVLAHAAVEQQRLQRALGATAEPAAQASADAASPAADPLAALRLQVQQREALRAQLARDDAWPVDAAGVVDAVIAALPDAMWLSEVEVGAAGALRIAGGTLETAALTGFAERLGRVAALRGLRIETLRVDPAPRAADGEGDGAADTAAVAARPARLFVLASVGHAAGRESADGAGPMEPRR